jgi:hypothetical protein
VLKFIDVQVARLKVRPLSCFTNLAPSLTNPSPREFPIKFFLPDRISFLPTTNYAKQLNDQHFPVPGGGMRLLLIRHGETVDNVAGI